MSSPPASSRGRIPGEPGAWAFILGDMAIFSMFFGVIVYYGATQPEMFAASQKALSQELGLLNTIVLLAGSLFVVHATRAVATGRLTRADRLLGAAVACGALFTLIKAVEYAGKVQDDLVPRTNDFFLVFYCFTAVHLLHVLLGVACLAVLRRRVRIGLPGPRDHELLESGACYWHMVDLLWLVLFPLLYVVS